VPPELEPDPAPEPELELPDDEPLDDPPPELEPDPELVPELEPVEPELEPLPPPLLLPVPPANIWSCASDPLNSSASPPDAGSVSALCQKIHDVHALGSVGQLTP